MYNPASIAPLSEAQISKALKGLPVRVSAGNQHDVELSKEPVILEPSGISLSEI
jgi:hypothetical protein